MALVLFDPRKLYFVSYRYCSIALHRLYHNYKKNLDTVPRPYVGTRFFILVALSLFATLKKTFRTSHYPYRALKRQQLSHLLKPLPSVQTMPLPPPSLHSEFGQLEFPPFLFSLFAILLFLRLGFRASMLATSYQPGKHEDENSQAPKCHIDTHSLPGWMLHICMTENSIRTLTL